MTRDLDVGAGAHALQVPAARGALLRASSDGPTTRPLDVVAERSSPTGGEGPPSTVVGDEPLAPHHGEGLPIPEPEGYLPLAAEDVLFQGDFVSRYSVLSRLGRGGMGVVYKAYDPQLDRNIALKVLRHDSGADLSTNEIRLLSEAQTLAKLRHPNIVAVFDAGPSPQGVFVAMELVEGQTLGNWLDDTPRQVDQIVQMFAEAGKGLAAAHEAGVVHRDFKPSNVLLGDDGIVRVLDFGLAQLVDTSPSPEHRPTEDLLLVATGGGMPDSTGTSTASGVLMGTPAYMAPEQLARKRVDERSDQYTFCLCLHMALGGEPPDRGVELDAVIARIATPPRRTALGTVPSRVRRALDRGLALDPNARFESMEALLAELAEPPRRWKNIIAGGALAVGFSLGAVVFAGDEDTPCAGLSAGLRQVWDDDERRFVRDAFTGSGHQDSAQLLERVETKLDDYTREMVEMYDRSCQATYVDHHQPEALFNQQALCLERRRSQVKAAVATLAAADSPQAVVERMVLPFKLPALDACMDADALASQLPLPDDARQREQIAELRERIDAATALSNSGDARGAIDQGLKLVEDARAQGYPPVLAEALEALGAAQVSGMSAREAEKTLSEAIEVAASAKSDEVGARAWTWLLYALMAQGEFERGLGHQLAARAAVKRTSNRITEAWLLNNLGALHGKVGDSDIAIDHMERSLELKKDALGGDHYDVAISWFNLGTARVVAERYDDAYSAYEQARTGFEATVGGNHPHVHQVLWGLCSVEQKRQNIGRALELCDAALDHVRALPWSTSWMGQLSFTAAKVQWDAKQYERARATAEQARQDVLEENSRLADTLATWLDEHPLPEAGETRSDPEGVPAAEATTDAPTQGAGTTAAPTAPPAKTPPG